MLISRRSPLAVVALLSLVATLLALPVMPAAATNGEPDDLPLYSACASPAIGSAGFEDVSARSVARDAINCMVHYGIMPGTSSTMFEPDLGVTRQEMALILIRAAGPAGIDIPRARDQGFDDIGHLPANVRDSINQLAQLDITHGTTDTTYTPERVVNRREMAQFFTRFLREAPVGEGGVDVESVIPDDRVFTDIEELPHDPYSAIRLIYELGVTEGTTTTTYSPTDPVTRAQMALFVSRMLAHTNARPAGITMQVEDTSVTADDTVDIVVSLRDENHDPMVDASIDLFYVAEGDTGFVSNGRCSSKAIIEAGDSRCTVDLGDEITDGDGNLFYTMEIPESLTVYAWTGDRNDSFDIDSTDHATLELSVSKTPDGFLLTDDMPEGALRLPFGDTVTFTFQVVDEDDNPVAVEDAEIRILTVEENDGRQIRDRTRTYPTDSSGRVELTFRLTDPDSDSNDPHGELNLEVLRHDYRRMTDKSTVEINTPSKRLRWSDDDADPTTVLLEQSLDYSTASDTGRNRVTATLLDQYGDPVRGTRIHFTSTDEDGLHQKPGGDALNAYRKTTSRRGVATVTYTRNSDDSRTEEITALAEGCTTCLETIKHYWVDDDPENLTILGGRVLHYDADQETLIIEDVNASSELYAIYFDAEDQFNDGLPDDPSTKVPISYRAFKEALAKEEEERTSSDYNIDVVVEGSDPDDVNRFTL
ncbi:MAG: S-layer homology domain-containing protein [bacterium]|nr:S-layer homology domain-containing protein [bacterium]